MMLIFLFVKFCKMGHFLLGKLERMGLKCCAPEYNPFVDNEKLSLLVKHGLSK